MSDDDLKKGFLTASELFEVWLGSVDAEYGRPFEEILTEEGAGDATDTGTEPIVQMLVQMERASKAVDVTTQAMFISPHSMQTNPSAQGEARATVQLSITRGAGGFFGTPLVLKRGEHVIEETEFDFGEDGPVEVMTGRRFVLTETAFFPPNFAGPVLVMAEAERPGYGYNNPQPGTLRTVLQPGTSFTNDFASTTRAVPPLTLARVPRAKQLVYANNQAEAFVPEHVGQYIQFTDGSNVNRVGHISDYLPADASVPHGGVVEIDNMYVLGVAVGTALGTFEEGEQFTLSNPTITNCGRVIATRVEGAVLYIAIVIDSTLVSGGGPPPYTLTGLSSGATAILALATEILFSSEIAVETNTAAWRITDWVQDWGLSVTNAAQPTGGRIGILDELGAERKVYRAPGESDTAYLRRITEVADTVSPNAIRRAMNKVLVPLSKKGYLREIGTDELFTGFFFDGSSSDPFDSACAFDFDVTIRPTDRFKVIVSYEEMRGFFLVGVPDIPDSGDFGFFFDGTDASDGFAFDESWFDGYPVTTSDVYRQLWNAIDPIKAGGVGFDFYKETVDPTTE